MWITGLFVATALLYAAATGVFLAFLSRGKQALGSWAMRTLATASILHLAYIITDWQLSGNDPFEDIHGTLAVLSLLVIAGFLTAALKYRITVLGAFITPLTLLFLLGAGLSRGVGQVPPGVRSFLLPLHIGLNVLGIVAFALAFAAAVGYVIQERLLRRKKIGGLFQRLPALDVLDHLGLRLVMIGFPLLTMGIVTGTIWAVRLDTPSITAAQGLALLTWLVFASILLLRVAVGLRGRRAAIGTIMGFVCALAVLAGYMFRAGLSAGAL
jgi:ABC-type uncharacterized transport system permease subunit